MYRLDYSDEEDVDYQLPSTPDRQRRSARFASPNVSTTPAGPPPTSFTGLSTTPAGPPPASSVFGSSRLPPPPPSFAPTNGSLSRNVPSSPPPLVQSAAIRVDADYDFEESDPDAMDEDYPLEDPFLSYANIAPTQKSLFRPGALSLDVLALNQSVQSEPLDLTSHLVADTENIIYRLYQTVNATDVDLIQKDLAMSDAVQRLTTKWDKPVRDLEQLVWPGKTVKPAAKAGYVASLLLPLHHEPVQEVLFGVQAKKPMPQVLKEWLDSHHWPMRALISDCLTHHPNPTAHESYWDTVLNAGIHCDLDLVLALLRAADWSEAQTAAEDREDGRYGYEGRQLITIERVVQDLMDVIEACPAMQHGDYAVTNADWSVWRMRVENADIDLQEQAEGESADRYAAAESRFRGSGDASQGLTFSQMSRRAESKVPWTIYESIRYLYGIFLGEKAEIGTASDSWLEVTIAATFWWNGDEASGDSEALRRSSRSSRNFPTKPAAHRPVDINPHSAYLAQLREIIEGHLGDPQTADEADLRLDASDPIQVGVACALAGEIEGVVALLTAWSPTIGTSVVEIAELGGWLGAPSGKLMEDFNQSDLMVLSYGGPQSQSNKRDDALRKYADLLEGHDFASTDSPSSKRAGWKLAVEILGRSHDRAGSNDRIKELLTNVKTTSTGQVNETIKICHALQLPEQASIICCKYADHLVASTSAYGEAVYYYVQAGAAHKVRDLLDLLTTLSLVQSTAYPPTATLHDSLHQLISSPHSTLSTLQHLDPTSASEVIGHISGYASIRKFYDTRDARATTSLLSRRKQTAPILIALLQSASDAIHGGLYDNSLRTAIPVDALLVLLGECLAYVALPQRIFSTPQLFIILKALEDLSTVSSGVRARAEDTFKAVLRAAHGSPPPSPAAVLRREPSGSGSGMAGSAFSLIGSELLKSTSNAPETESSAVLIPRAFPRRMWDWRAGLEAGTKGDDVLTILRLKIAEEVARGWMGRFGA